MKGLQDVLDEERKDWGEQLALLRETVTNLEDLRTARAQIAGLKQEISGLKQEIAGLEKTLKMLQQNQTQKSHSEGDIQLQRVYAASNQSAILSLVCVVLLLVNLAFGGWIWHRVNQTSSNLYTLIQIQQQQKNP